MRKHCPKDIEIRIDASSAGEIAVEAEAKIPVCPKIVWHVLTDYNRLAETVPGLASSRLAHENGEKKLEQVAEYKTPLFQVRLKTVFRLVETPIRHISFTAIEGDFDRFEGEWTLLSFGGKTHLHYHAVVSPRMYVPQFVLGRRLKKEIEHQLESVTVQACREGCPEMENASS